MPRPTVHRNWCWPSVKHAGVLRAPGLASEKVSMWLGWGWDRGWDRGSTANLSPGRTHHPNDTKGKCCGVCALVTPLQSFVMKQMARGSLDHTSSKDDPALWYESRGTEVSLTIEKLPFSCLCSTCVRTLRSLHATNSLCTGFYLSKYDNGVLDVEPTDVGE